MKNYKKTITMLLAVTVLENKFSDSGAGCRRDHSISLYASASVCAGNLYDILAYEQGTLICRRRYYRTAIYGLPEYQGTNKSKQYAK